MTNLNIKGQKLNLEYLGGNAVVKKEEFNDEKLLSIFDKFAGDDGELSTDEFNVMIDTLTTTASIRGNKEKLGRREAKKLEIKGVKRQDLITFINVVKEKFAAAQSKIEEDAAAAAAEAEAAAVAEQDKSLAATRQQNLAAIEQPEPSVIAAPEPEPVAQSNMVQDKIVVQLNETPKQIAEKFGCTVEELLDANPGALKRNKKGITYLLAGAQLNAPKPYDRSVLEGRKDSEEVEQEYIARVNTKHTSGTATNRASGTAITQEEAKKACIPPDTDSTKGLSGLKEPAQQGYNFTNPLGNIGLMLKYPYLPAPSAKEPSESDGTYVVAKGNYTYRYNSSKQLETVQNNKAEIVFTIDNNTGVYREYREYNGSNDYCIMEVIRTADGRRQSYEICDYYQEGGKNMYKRIIKNNPNSQYEEYVYENNNLIRVITRNPDGSVKDYFDYRDESVHNAYGIITKTND